MYVNIANGWSLKLLRLPFNVIHHRSEDNPVAVALSRLFNHESEFNECHADIAHQSEGCLNFPKSDKSLEAEINHLAVLEQTSRSLPVKINSPKPSKNWKSKKRLIIRTL